MRIIVGIGIISKALRHLTVRTSKKIDDILNSTWITPKEGKKNIEFEMKQKIQSFSSETNRRAKGEGKAQIEEWRCAFHSNRNGKN